MSQTTVCYTLNLDHVICRLYLCKAGIRGGWSREETLFPSGFVAVISLSQGRRLPENEAKTRKQGQEVDTWVQSSLTEGEEG